MADSSGKTVVAETQRTSQNWLSIILAISLLFSDLREQMFAYKCILSPCGSVIFFASHQRKTIEGMPHRSQLKP